MKTKTDNTHHHTSANIRLAFFLNLFFSAIELVGGLLTNSVAILSDALHDFGDSFSLALAWYFQKVSKRKRDAKYSYGYRRFSLLGAMINSVVLLIGSFFVISESIQRLISPQAANAKGMLLLAIFGILVNGWAMWRMRRSSSLNERAVGLHLLEDVLGWAAVLIGSIVMIFVDVPILDPLLSLLIACYILLNIYRNLRDTLRVVLQGTPSNVNMEAIEACLQSMAGIKSVHDMHIWSMDGEYNIMSVHLVLDKNLDYKKWQELKMQIKEKLKAQQIQHITIESETDDDACDYKTEEPQS
ncbi:MAG: cation diffusion facilitator family transporter [Bacteroidales bacterium]|jgi:cobalt-zinc-cadmium efflux system protein|nr:cation diffusion facilitator family transporter [Bacteroidales bacterium]